MTMVAATEPALWHGKALPGQDELPCDDGEPMETEFHDSQATLLKETLIDHWRERRDYCVAGNMFVYFSERQVKNNDFRGPDVFVVLGVERKPRKSWVAWEEGGQLPDLVIEVTSESTEKVDRGEKMQIYAQIWRTASYFIFDPETERLEGYALDAAQRRYVPLTPDERGDLAASPLGLKLGLRQTAYRDHDRPFVRWIETDGTPVPTLWEHAEQERARADQERARADQERARADQERARAEAALERVKELERKGSES
jgi:Uma2 family endonuclease